MKGKLIHNIILGTTPKDMIGYLDYTLNEYLEEGTVNYKYFSMDFDALRLEIDKIRVIYFGIIGKKLKFTSIIDEWEIWNLDFAQAWEINYELDNYNAYIKENGIEVNSQYVKSAIYKEAYTGIKSLLLSGRFNSQYVKKVLEEE